MTPLLLLCSLLASSAEGYVRPQLTKTAGTISMKINMQPILDRRNVLSSSFASAVVSATALGIPRAAFADKVVDASSIETTDKGVKFVTVKEGSCPASDFTGVLGSCRPSPGKFIIIDYTAFLPNGQVFDSTEKKGGKPLAFQLGSRQVISGIEEVVEYMKPGQEVQAFIPSKLAYGSKGVCTEDGECLIPPDTNLKYYIKLIRVTSAAG